MRRWRRRKRSFDRRRHAGGRAARLAGRSPRDDRLHQRGGAPPRRSPAIPGACGSSPASRRAGRGRRGPQLGVAQRQSPRERAADRPLPAGAVAAARLRRRRRARARGGGPRRAATRGSNGRTISSSAARNAPAFWSRGARFADRRFACVVGIGVNCAHAPEGVGYPTAVASARRRRRDRRRATCSSGLPRGSTRRSTSGRAATDFAADPRGLARARRRNRDGRADRRRARAGGREPSRGLTPTADCCFAGRADSRRSRPPTSGYRRRRKARPSAARRFARAGRPSLNDRQQRVRFRGPRGPGRNRHELRALRLRAAEGAQMADGRSRRRLRRRRPAGRRSHHARRRLHREGEEGPRRPHHHPRARGPYRRARRPVAEPRRAGLRVALRRRPRRGAPARRAGRAEDSDPDRRAGRAA